MSATEQPEDWYVEACRRARDSGDVYLSWLADHAGELRRANRPGSVGWWIDLWFDGQLPSKSNPPRRRSERQEFYKHRVEPAELVIADMARKAWRRKYGTGIEGPGGLLEFAADKHKTVAILCRKQRIDANNAPKLVCDALEGVCYANDKEVESRAKNMEDQSGTPGVAIRVWWRTKQA